MIYLKIINQNKIDNFCKIHQQTLCVECKKIFFQYVAYSLLMINNLPFLSIFIRVKVVLLLVKWCG